MFIKLKTESLSAKLQNSNQNCTFSWVNSLTGSQQPGQGATLLGWPKSIYYTITFLLAWKETVKPPEEVARSASSRLILRRLV